MAQWKKQSGNWYLYDNNGKKLTGWQRMNGTWYYLNDKGVMQTGWVKSNGGSWYYLNSSGAMQTGQQSIGGHEYIFDSSGRLKSSDKYDDTNGLYKSYQSALSDYNKYADNPEKYGYNSQINTVNDLFNQIMSQEEFSYDPQKDSLFQMYKKQYDAQGKRDMQNQMGVATAFSGGYNSSAAQTAAQQQYANAMDELSSKAADTYQNALEMYRYNQQNLLDRYNVATDMNNAGNEAYWAQLNAKNQRASNAYAAYNDDRNFQYNMYAGDRSYLQTQAQNKQTQANWQKEFDNTNAWNKKNYELNKKLYTG